MNLRLLPLKNLKRKAGRTAALLIVVTLLSLSMLGGALVVRSLQSGLGSLETRLGADIMVVPDEASSKKNLEAIVLDGVPGYFYMDKSYLDKVAAREGIARITAQYYLATAKAGCCSMPIQIIGFDPETDFSVTPWIRQSYHGNLQPEEIVIGCDINRPVGATIRMYGIDCTVTAQLDRTGTALDTACYATVETIKDLIRGSEQQNMTVLAMHDPDKIISSILIRVADGYSVDQVVGDINLHVRGVKATATKRMLSGISDSLSGVANIVRLLMVAVWILVLVILLVVFSSMINERKKEFAVLRVIGLSRGALSRIILAESAIVSFAGGVVGCLLSVAVIYPFGNLFEQELGLPFLAPKAGVTLLLALVSVLACVAVGAAASLYAAQKLSKVDPGLSLREGT